MQTHKVIAKRCDATARTGDVIEYDPEVMGYPKLRLYLQRSALVRFQRRSLFPLEVMRVGLVIGPNHRDISSSYDIFGMCLGKRSVAWRMMSRCKNRAFPNSDMIMRSAFVTCQAGIFLHNQSTDWSSRIDCAVKKHGTQRILGALSRIGRRKRKTDEIDVYINYFAQRHIENIPEEWIASRWASSSVHSMYSLILMSDSFLRSDEIVYRVHEMLKRSSIDGTKAARVHLDLIRDDIEQSLWKRISNVFIEVLGT